jgi:hypothetical protein
VQGKAEIDRLHEDGIHLAMSPEAEAAVVKLFLEGQSINHICFLLDYRYKIDDVAGAIRSALAKALERGSDDAIQTRDTTRLILGDCYEEAVLPFRENLRKRCQETCQPLAQCALELCRELESERRDATLIICALVEEAGA